MRIVLLGAPGSGKGTQSQHLVARAGIPQISTGDLLRAAVERGSELGLKAKEAMAAGRLVDDDIVLGMIRERLAEPDTRRGFILDGFPRNLAQAHALERLLTTLKQPLDAVVQLEVDYSELVRRLSGRRSCADCGRVFNVLTAPAAAHEPCPKTGAPHRLIQRGDDNEATVRERLRVYEEKTRPLIDFYRARGLLRVIDAAGDVHEVTRRLMKAIGAPATRRARKPRGAAGGTSRKKGRATRTAAAAPAAPRRRAAAKRGSARSAKRRSAAAKSRTPRARRRRVARRR
jgi:adenylate kinase